MARQVIQFDFSGGVNQQADQRHVQPGELTGLVNGQFDKVGSIRKRAGFTALSRSLFSGGGSVSVGKHLSALADELVMFDGSSVYSYSTAAGKLVQRDDAGPFGVLPRTTLVQSASVSRTSNTTPAQDNVTPDVAYCGGYYVVSYLAQHSYGAGATVAGFGQPRYLVIDATTGAHVSSGTLQTTTSYMSARLAVIGSEVFMVYADNGGHIFGRKLNMSTFSLSLPSTIASNAFVGNSVDVAVATEGTKLYIVYRNSSGVAPFLNYAVTDTTFGGLSSNTVNTPGAFAAATVARIATVVTSGETWWIGYVYTQAGSAYGYTVGHSPTTYAQTIAPTLVLNATGTTGDAFSCSVARISSANVMIAGSWTNTGTGHNPISTYFRQSSTGAVTVGNVRIVPHAVLASKIFTSGSRFYAWFCTFSGYSPDSVQETLVCGDLYHDNTTAAQILPRPVAMTAPRIASAKGGLTTTAEIGNIYGSMVASVATNGTTLVTVAVTKPGSTTARAIDLVPLTTTPKRVTAELGQVLYSSGGVTSAFDGEHYFEASFLTYPETPQTVTTLNGSGSLTNSGVYRYVLVATAYNAHGEVMMSSPSVPTDAVTLGVGDDTVRFWVSTLPFTSITENDPTLGWYVTLDVYRTKNGGSTYYRVPSQYIVDVALGTTGPILNDPYNNIWEKQYEDRASDANLDGQPLLYVTGGVLSNVAPPGSEIIAVHQDRLFVADGKDVWFSTKRSSKAIGFMPRFNELQRITIEDGGNITALASVGGLLAIFKRDRIFMVAGDGPDLDGGTGQEFSPPARVSSDVGCIEPRSIAVCPAGTVFQSISGIYLLTPGGQVQYIGGKVQDTLDANPTITSARVHETEFQVRFTCSSSGATGVVLVWDYFPIPQAPEGRWSIFQLYETNAAQASSAIAGAANCRGVYHWLAPNGTIYQETPSAYLDGSQWVTMSVETAWIHLAGLQGFQRVWSVALLGEYFTDHDILFGYKVDYVDSYVETKTKNVQSAFGLEQVEYTPRQQKCQAMRITFTDATPSAGSVGTGRALSLTGLALEVKQIPNINRLPSTKRT